MKKVLVGLLAALLILQHGTAAALSREGAHALSKYSLAGGLLGALGFSGYIAHLNKAIEEAPTAEEKAELLRRKNLVKKLHIFALALAAGGGAGLFVSRGKNDTRTPPSPGDQALAQQGGDSSVYVPLHEPRGHDVAPAKSVLKSPKSASPSRELPVPRRVNFVSEDVQLLPRGERLEEMYDVLRPAAHALIERVLGRGVIFDAQLFAEKQLDAVRNVQTLDGQERALCNVMWNAYMMRISGVISQNDGDIIARAYSEFALESFEKDFIVHETWPPRFHLEHALPVVLRELPRDAREPLKISREAAAHLVEMVMGVGVPFDPMVFTQKQMQAIEELPEAFQRKALQNAIFNAYEMVGTYFQQETELRHALLAPYEHFAHDELQLDVAYQETAPISIIFRHASPSERS